LIEGYFGNTAPVDYSFDVVRVVDTTAAMSVGATVNGAITQPGQTNSFTFTLAEAGRFIFDSLTNDGLLSWTLTGPGGIEVASRNFIFSDGKGAPPMSF